MHTPLELSTPRLTLLGANEILLRAELHSPDQLAAVAGAVVPAEWPPEHHDRGVIEWVLNSLVTISPHDPWRFYYIALKEPRTLVGNCGFKQPPDSKGCVEVGYSVLERFQRRGFASEAVKALMELAFAGGAAEVAAETFPSLVPSLRVMQKCGMSDAGQGSEPGSVRYTKRR